VVTAEVAPERKQLQVLQILVPVAVVDLGDLRLQMHKELELPVLPVLRSLSTPRRLWTLLM
jgi:hypothetical protein